MQFSKPSCDSSLEITTRTQGALKAFAGSLHCMALFLTVLLIVGLVIPAAAEDNDYPHNYVQNASCNTGTCHAAYGGGAGPDYKLGDVSCLFCHDDTNPANSLTAPTVASHSSATTSAKYGTWAMKCIDCHHEHLQAQYWAYGQDSYVVSGISDPGGITVNTLTMTGAGWESNSLAGMVLFPNIEDLDADWSNYGIISNTADTITVKGPMMLNGGPWDTPIGTGNKRFAVVYGQGISHMVPDDNPGVTQKPVRFFRSSGANSFADGDATYDGICEVCHTKTSHHRNNGTAPYQSHFNGSRCTACHPHANGFKALPFDHTLVGAVLPTATCQACHEGTDPVVDVHGNQCDLCHVNPGGGGPLIEPYESTVPQGGDCIDCHGLAQHQDAHREATPGSGSVAIFPYAGHDDAGGPYYDIIVDCGMCHVNDIIQIHGSNCSTCHPTFRDSFTTWNGGCQQGGCHSVYHESSTTAHLPFDDPKTTSCQTCHEQSNWAVPEYKCLNCHGTSPNDTTPPVTTANVVPVYNGTAKIDFSITDNGRVGIGTTFYKLDGGPVISGPYAIVSTGGLHNLEFWSIDQAGNVESPPNTASFEVVVDTTPPTTTSNAQNNYYQGGTIILSATDNSNLGIKNTYYRLGESAIQSGTLVNIPATDGIITYTLTFWSEDWAGNIEAEKSVTFTVTSGTGTIRLIWGYSDSSALCAADPAAEASWIIRKSSFWGPVVASGSGSCPSWSGVNDVTVQVGPTPYFVTVNWWDSEGEFYDQKGFSNILITTPGQLVMRRY